LGVGSDLDGLAAGPGRRGEAQHAEATLGPGHVRERGHDVGLAGRAVALVDDHARHQLVRADACRRAELWSMARDCSMKGLG